eukprot:GCRY01000480.1.p1 GENE.GCRY01000480.1~~GCRY01000480.1.p1  ORF type:complete len:212 (+),score=26.53 GCRY01000480.1:97-732(+)
MRFLFFFLLAFPCLHFIFDPLSYSNMVKENVVPIIDCPFFLSGEVVRGFGRGSKLLGFPTANISTTKISNVVSHLKCGVYYGYARVNIPGYENTIFEMVMNAGYNPQFKNAEASVEVHILHKFEEDFYGADIKVIVVDFLRGEKVFPSLDDLISAIKSDISTSIELLGKAEDFKKNPIFSAGDPSGFRKLSAETPLSSTAPAAFSLPCDCE